MLGRLPTILAGVFAGITVSVAAPGAGSWLRQIGPDSVIVGDTHGVLAEICVHYDRDFHDQSIETIADLVGALGSRTVVRVVVAERWEFDALVGDLDALGVGGLDRLDPVVTGFPITPWAKDRFGTFSRAGRAVIAVPPARAAVPGPRGNDERVPDLLCDELSAVRCEALPFFFEGGDLLADERHVFVTSTLLGRNPPLSDARRDELLQAIGEATGRTVVPIGREPGDVPDHHVGMYLTPLGDGVVAVADPELGARIAREAETRDDPPAITDDPAEIDKFHRVARDLESRGFEVLRVPLLLTTAPRVYVSYNNALLEQDAAGRRIYMPAYGLQRLDAAATQVFQQQGWQVVPVRVAQLYRHTGSLRCLVGVLSRA